MTASSTPQGECARVGCRSQERIGILVAQLGTPDAPTPRALRTYLRQFLSDRRVIEVNRILWWFILNCIVLVTRPRRSAALYRRIWGAEGSPLLTITRRQATLLKERLAADGVSVEVEVGMRYGSPSIEKAVDALCDKGVTKLLILPMYPQYAAATTASTYDAAFSRLLARRYVPTVRVVSPYYRHPRYLSALAATIAQSLATLPWKPQRVILSYHGVPESYVVKGDPYCCHCTETTQSLLPYLQEKAGLTESEVQHCFQSRFGKEPWLTPYTDETLEALPSQGIKDVAIAAPGFTADCLETLDELGNEGREQFTEHGGERYHFIPCLNDDPHWIEALHNIVSEEIGTWVQELRRTSPCPYRTCPAKLGSASTPK